MNKERWQRVRKLFQAAARLPEAERADWLRNECGDDTALADEVLALLGTGDAAGSGIDDIVDAAASDFASTAASGERIGPYRVINTLGRGGMGEVYLAERADEAFRQKVAIKTVGWLGASTALIERFRVERQILADLQHPYIARLLDGGQTDKGTPYLVMEYVDGRTITDWCDEQQLDLGERLGLFLKVCEALRYAHRKLVVHRDIKPSNILIDAAGDPRLLDFGIAKLLDPADPAAAGITRADMRVLTPEYASPEQVRGEAATVATDVYGLGLLLYQLLTGHFPYNVDQASSPNLADIICNTEPTSPSTAVRRGGGKPNMPLDVSQLARSLAGDLDNIVMMALRKEPERRYESVSDLARDVRNYLERRPVSARTPSLGYRASRFVSRNRTGVAAGAAAVLAIVLSTGWYTHRLQIERDIAEQERATAEAATGFMVDLFEVSDPAQALGKELTAREVLDSGAEKLREGLENSPVVRARLLQTLGNVYERLGLYDEAQRLLEESLELGREALAPDSEAQLRTMEQLAWVYTRREDWPRVIGLAEEALVLREQRLGSSDPSLAKGLNMIGTAAYWQDDIDTALRQYLRSLTVLTGDDEETLIDRAVTHSHLGITYAHIGEFEQAEKHYLASLELRLQQLDPMHPRIGLAKANLGAFYHGRNQFEKAKTFAEEALEIDRNALGDEHADVAYDLGLLAAIHLALGDHETAEDFSRRAVDTWRQAVGPQHSRYGSALDKLATILMERNKLDEALDIAQQCYEVMSTAHGADHTLTAEALYTRGRVYLRRDEYREAMSDFEATLEIRARSFDDGHPAYQSVLGLMAQAELGLGNGEEAERLANHLLGLVEAGAADDRVRLRRALVILSRVLRGNGDTERLAAIEQRIAALDADG